MKDPIKEIRKWMAEYMERTTIHYGTDKHGITPEDLEDFLSTLDTKE